MTFGRGKYNPKVPSSTFYRVVREFKDAYCTEPIYDVFEFHKCINNYMYIKHFEACNVTNENTDRHHIYSDRRLGFDDYAKEVGNKRYKELLSKGYTKVGVFECDIFGYNRRLK